jgi:rfaE bifunctional protein kinase chain/domain
LNVECSGVVVAAGHGTTTKMRILAGHLHSTRQQVVRMDYESGVLKDEGVLADLAANVRAAFEKSDAAVVSDYNYGVACKTTVAPLRSSNRHVPVAVDSRFRMREFAGFDSATPNEDEVEQVAGRRFADADELAEEGERLRAELEYKSLLITRGKHGMVLLEEGKRPLHLGAVGSHDAVDVTGAGDTVIATYALALASGADYATAARLANHAGGIVVLKRGTACVHPQELLASLEHEGQV